MRRATLEAITRAFRRMAAPLVCYYGVTIGVPLANGAAGRDAAFVEHALFVLLLPAVSITLAAASWSCVAALRHAPIDIPVDGRSPVGYGVALKE